jgi:hypothetical protein
MAARAAPPSAALLLRGKQQWVIIQVGSIACGAMSRINSPIFSLVRSRKQIACPS